MAHLEGLVTAHHRLVGGWESLRIEIDPTEPVVGDHPRGDCPGHDDVVRGADARPAASVGGRIRAVGGADSEGDHVKLDAAESLLCSDAVLVLLALDLSQAGVVVALEGSRQASEVLEAALLGSHVGLLAAVLRHLDLPLVVGAVPDGEGDGGRVGVGVGEVEVS